MNKYNRQFLREALASFVSLYAKKFKVGDKEHGGIFAQKAGMIHELKKEIMDEWSYAENINFQVSFANKMLENPTPTNVQIAKRTLEALLEKH